MNKNDIIQMASKFVKETPLNTINSDIAISKSVVGLRIFDEPIFAFGSAEDETFQLFVESNAIGEHFLCPEKWLVGAKSVISFFLPFTKAVIVSNRKTNEWPSNEWLHGRIEGNIVLNELAKYLNNTLIERGYNSVVPSNDERFWSKTSNGENSKSYTSNWSERHVAYACGLGTFGLSKGLITRKGTAGRIGSIVTELYLEPDKKEYRNLYEYCTMCGACVKKCPVQAISLKNGKDHKICATFLEITKEKYKPRYGCGKCQVSVPCETRIPRK